MHRTRQVLQLLGAIALTVGLCAPVPAAQTATVAAAPPGVVKATPNLRMADLAGRSDSDVVEFPDKRRMRVGDLRRLDAAARKMRAAAPTKSLPPGLKAAPATTGTRMNNAVDLAAALKRGGGDTLQLPSGRRVTADQLRFLQPEIEKRLGRKIDEPPRQPSRTGPAIKVSQNTTKDEWKDILQKPDETVLESPSGKRVTIGEIKQALAKPGRRTTAVRPQGVRP